MTTEMREPIVGGSVWRGEELNRRADWNHALRATEIGEVESALGAVMMQGLSWQDINSDNFSLPGLETRLDAVRGSLEHGSGIAKITGIDVERYSEAELRCLYYGLMSNLGTPVSMSTQGMMMSDVTDEGADRARHGALDTDGGKFLSSRARVHSTGQLRYHNDRCDVVGLLCIDMAKSGGVNKLVSVPAIHNEMLAQRPDLVEELYKDYYRSRLGEESGDNAAFYALPIFGMEKGNFTCHYSRTYIEAAQLNDDVPKMRAAQWAAIEMMAELAEKFAFETAPARGEILLMNNHVVYHSRTAYEDDAAAGRFRLLYRIWLSMPDSRPLPKCYEVLFHDSRPGTYRGGIRPIAAQVGRSPCRQRAPAG